MAFNIIKPGFMQSIGVNRLLAVQGASDAVMGAAGGAAGFADALWNEDGTAFQRAANGASEFVGGGIGIASSLLWGYGVHRTFMGKLGKGRIFNDVLAKDGKFMQAMKHGGSGSLRDIFTGDMIHGDAADKFRKGALKGYWRQPKGAISGKWYAPAGAGKPFTAHTERGFASKTGEFMKHHWMEGKLGLGLLIGGQIALEAGINTTLGIAGQLLDESHMAYQQAKHHSYDTREFNNRAMAAWEQQNGMAAYGAMSNFENKMSLSRIYHHR